MKKQGLQVDPSTHLHMVHLHYILNHLLANTTKVTVEIKTLAKIRKRKEIKTKIPANQDDKAEVENNQVKSSKPRKKTPTYQPFVSFNEKPSKDEDPSSSSEGSNDSSDRWERHRALKRKLKSGKVPKDEQDEVFGPLL